MCVSRAVLVLCLGVDSDKYYTSPPISPLLSTPPSPLPASFPALPPPYSPPSFPASSHTALSVFPSTPTSQCSLIGLKCLRAVRSVLLRRMESCKGCRGLRECTPLSFDSCDTNIRTQDLPSIFISEVYNDLDLSRMKVGYVTGVRDY